VEKVTDGRGKEERGWEGGKIRMERGKEGRRNY